MRTLALVTLAAGLFISEPLFAAGEVDFDGTFSEAQSSNANCDQVFATDAYHAKHALAGPGQRISVLKFTHEDGFFNGMVLVGRLGPDDDLYYDKTLTTGSWSYDVHAEGFIDYSVLYLEFTVTGSDAAGTTTCKATAIYSAFN